MRAVLDRGVEVDAVFAMNDLLALGALRTLFECGRAVPDDVAVAGFDDIQEARFGRPSLTTIEPGRSEISRTAVELLLDGGGPPHGDGPRLGRHVTAGFSLQVRESTGAAPAGPAPACSGSRASSVGTDHLARAVI